MPRRGFRSAQSDAFNMMVYLNGEFVPHERAVVSVFDRGFLYGDGAFETIRVFRGRPVRFEQHFARLQRGAEFLKISFPHSASELRACCLELLRLNRVASGALRITLSRGVGVRGYSPRSAEKPTLVIAAFPRAENDASAPQLWKLVTSSLRVVANDPVAQHKTCSKVHHVLARAEADAAGADDALLLNDRGEITEATGSNLFWIEGDTLCTPPVSAGILPGITRALILELCREQGLPRQEKTITPERLRELRTGFLTLSSFGIIEIAALDGIEFTSNPLIDSLRDSYRRALQRETGDS